MRFALQFVFCGTLPILALSRHDYADLPRLATKLAVNSFFRNNIAYN